MPNFDARSTLFMAGLYIHIPFCKQACYYCNFHFSTSLRHRDDMVAAIVEELDLRKAYLNGATLDSIYIGGGTPSLLNDQELGQIFEQINRLYPIADHAEITLEANPDDLSKERLQLFAQSSINRLSIGIQSFSEADLRFMNRAHSALEAQHCIQLARDCGFESMSVDLIYGSPSTSAQQWADNLQQVIDLQIPHLSCYCLTVEPGTALDHFVRKGKEKPVDEEKAADQFEYMQQTLNAAGYLHYEISNFAQPGQMAVHNSNYWKGVPYLGIGPSAHSFNGQSRQWNIAHNAKYLKAIQQKEVPCEVEILSSSTRYNEYIMTALRTMWGVDLRELQNLHPTFTDFFVAKSQAYINRGQLIRKGDQFSLKESARLLADGIAMELFWEE
ncbi:MAG: radical SAM family heme chaperone HemW [Bacteroidota bacterium]